MIERRQLLISLASALAAPAIVRYQSIMPVRSPRLPFAEIFDGDTITWKASYSGSYLPQREYATIYVSKRVWP